MAMRKTRISYSDTEEGKNIKLKLQQMANNKLYNTAASYSADNELYPNNLIPFVDKHMNYLINHPALEASMYLANVRLMTKVR